MGDVGRGSKVLSLERFIGRSCGGQGAQFVLCIREEIVGAVSNEVGAADFEQREHVLPFEQSEMPLLNKARVNNRASVRRRRPGTQS
jgi:hypothetical protein